ncbi:MAG: hypothetical protein EOO16_15830 [Chitinophagaceae bacterium]|nr:MAG: hypothetical protein EOO16_15830 [Chitinophagaceae bacterium]
MERDGSPVPLLQVQDVSGSESLRTEFQMKTALFEQVLAGFPGSVCVTDRGGTLLQHNGAPASIVNGHLLDSCPCLKDPVFIQAMERAWSGEELTLSNAALPRAPFSGRHRIQPVRAAEGTVLALVHLVERAAAGTPKGDGPGRTAIGCFRSWQCVERASLH